MRSYLFRWNVTGWLVLAAAVGLWEVVIRLRWVDLAYMPPPSTTLQAVSELIESGQLQTDVAHTLGVALRASALAMLIGTAVGTAFGLVPWVRAYFTATLDFMRTLPILALFPVAVLTWGPSSSSEVVVATYSATWPVILNTASGVRAVHARLRDVARVFHLTRWEALRKIVIPAAMPAILVGFRLAVVTALIVAMVAEMVINPEGIGWGLVVSSQALRPERMWAYAVVAGFLGYLVNAALVQVVRRALPGSPAIVGGGR